VRGALGGSPTFQRIGDRRAADCVSPDAPAKCLAIEPPGSISCILRAGSLNQLPPKQQRPRSVAELSDTNASVTELARPRGTHCATVINHDDRVARKVADVGDTPSCRRCVIL